MSWKVVHGFRKSDQNEKLHHGEPHSRYEARIQDLHQPEYSVLPLISENFHVLIVTAGIWRENPR
jgi:hypothetical protein